MKNCRTGVYICMCGTNIAKIVDVEAVASFVSGLPHVILARTYKYMCSNPGQEMIIPDIRDNQLNRVVVAACSPNMHERTFRNALRTAGLNQYLCEMANIREQCSWVHKDPQEATDKAKALVHAAICRVAFHEELESMSVNMCPNVLVVGGGIAGMTAALELADAGNNVHLVEKNNHLGGNLARVDLTAPYLYSAPDLLTERMTRITTNQQGHVYVESKVTELRGRSRDGRIETKEGKRPRYVAIIHCVGSRSQEFHTYCSRVCCMTALKYAHEIKSANPACYISDIYIDMHAFGKGHEDFYRQSSEAKTLFLMYEKDDRPVIHKDSPKDDCEMLIEVSEKLSGEHIEIPADLIILMVGMEAHEDSHEIARTVNISQDKDGWFIESHPKLEPVATTTDGIFIAGTCVAPKDIPDTVAQAR